MINYGKMIFNKNSGVSGGDLEYNYDDSTGVIVFTGKLLVVVGGFIPYPIPLDGQSKINPMYLQSTYTKPGMDFTFGNVDIKISQVSGNLATADITVDIAGKTFPGKAVIDLSQKDIRLKSLYATGSYYLQNFVIDAVAV